MINRIYFPGMLIMLCIQGAPAMSEPLPERSVCIIVTDATCFGAQNGMIRIVATGGAEPYLYYLDGNGPFGNPVFTNLATGQHHVMVVESDGTSSAHYVTVREPGEILLTGTIQPSACRPPGTGTDGCIFLTVSGGVPNNVYPFYDYLWSTSSPDQNICDLPCGPSTYWVTVTDANGCTKTGSWAFQDIFFVATITPSGGQCLGEISLAVTCANPPLTYWWEGPSGFIATVPTITGLIAGTYCVTVTDVNNFSKTCCWDVPLNKSACASTYLQNQIVLPGGNNCYDAMQTIYVAGNGTTFSVQNGGTATLIAGEKISFLPGTKVYQGGAMHGFITTTGQFCGDKSNGSNGDAEGAGNDTLRYPDITGNHVFRVWPNPTSGNFILELNGDQNDFHAQADIYSVHGRKIITAELTGETKHEFSLAAYPPGLYFVRVFSGKFAGTLKIIKQ